MLIAKYIGDLLFDYECVVIPGLGGFIINDKPALINYNTNYFSPPFPEIMFNPYLITNDGLLLNYIAKDENITYKEAKHKIDSFAIACHKALNSGKQVNFAKIGSIYKDKNDKIIFDQDTSVNYNPESFGLTSFISPPVRRINQEERIKNTFTPKKDKEIKKESKKEKRVNRRGTGVEEKDSVEKKVFVGTKKSPYKGQVIFVMLLVIAMISGWAYVHRYSVKYYYDRHGYKVPFFYSNNASYLANNVMVLPLEKMADMVSHSWVIKQLGKIGSDKETDKVSDKNFAFDNEKTKEPKEVQNIKIDETTSSDLTTDADDLLKETKIDDNNVLDNTSETVSKDIDNNEPETAEVLNNNEKPDISEPVIKHAKHESSYFIIAGSFKDKRNASNFIRKLKNKGFNAIVAGVNNLGMTRVAYSVYGSLYEAKQELRNIRNSDNPSAWIMRK